MTTLITPTSPASSLSDDAVFVGRINDDGVQAVTLEGKPLEPGCCPLCRSPRAFEWGADVPEAAQLAFALLETAISRKIAEEDYLRLAYAVVSRIPADACWNLTVGELGDWRRGILKIDPAKLVTPRKAAG